MQAQNLHLKPENLLLTDHGFIKLMVMSFATLVTCKTYTTCGTPDYVASDLVASEEHTNAVDWWTLIYKVEVEFVFFGW